MSFFFGFVLGSMSGVAAEYYQSTYATPKHYNNNIINNIKDLKNDLVNLKDQSKDAVKTVSGIKDDVVNYAQDVKPDVENLKDSVTELKGNLDKLQNLNK
jgi:predicted  nucleic acid-binding Zn-ribbon protein